MKTIYFTQRTAARFFAVFAMFSLLAGMVPTQAFAAQVLIFSASANPTSIGMGQTVAVTFTIGNSASSNKDIKALRITVPSGFSASNFLISQPNWSVALNSGEIQGSLNSGPTGLTPGSQLTVTANITNVSATTATSWQTCTFINSSFAPGAGGDFNIVGGTGCGALAFSVPPTTGTLTVTKVVVNTGGGTKVVSDFPLFANANSVTSGVSNILAPATYTVTETNSVNYTASFSTSCPNGVIALAAGENKTCTITNTYVAPPIACTAPFTGFQPNCVPPPCPQGQTGTFPNCVTPPPPSCSRVRATSSPSPRSNCVSSAWTTPRSASGPGCWLRSDRKSVV